jgi:hypothetical protein
LLRRPDPDSLSEATQLFFIGRNNSGFWVARDEDGRDGGTFWFRQSAVRFAERITSPAPCALVFPSERFELDSANRAGLLDRFAVLSHRLWTQLSEARTDRPASGDGSKSADPLPGAADRQRRQVSSLKRKCIRFLRQLHKKTAVLGGGHRARAD